MANKIFPEGIKEQILSRGVKDMPQNPASQGYTKDQIREFYYRPEEMIIDCMLQIEDHIVGEDGIDERVVSLEEKIRGENGLEGKVETLETDNAKNQKDIESLFSGEDVIVEDIKRIIQEQAGQNEEISELKEKTKILNVDQTKPNRFLSEDGLYKEIKECECVPIVVDKELNENSTNVLENQAIAKAIKGKQDKLTAGENIKIENGVISAEGGSGGTNVEANPEEEATEDLSKLKVGDTVYDVPKNLYGEGTPTTAIIGKQGQKYIDTKTDKVYIYIDNAWVNLISGNTIKGSNGFLFSENILKLNSAYKSNIDGEYDNGTKDDNYLYYRPLPITILNYKYAVKRALTNPEDFNDSNQTRFIKNIWTDAEKAAARETLGITSSGGSGGSKIYKHTFSWEYDYGEGFTEDYHSGWFYSTISTPILEIEDTGYLTTGAFDEWTMESVIGDIHILSGSQVETMDIVIEEHFTYFAGDVEHLVNFNEIVTEV